ncbi:unnamed protein product [Schistocephalus solidus]|uniref:Integrase catalytic domain-containing protein n=1 Tax=Schistocephalus solidus TaxID=70667 RepID=A0A183TNX3_SCHSO|nr:unnamed protein product [Schistocephalus solidus]
MIGPTSSTRSSSNWHWHHIRDSLPVMNVPFLLPTMRRQVFSFLHGLSHPGVPVGSSGPTAARMRGIEFAFVSRGNVAEVICITFPWIGAGAIPDAPFIHIRLEQVVLLVPSSSSKCRLTCIDRFARYPFAMLISGISGNILVHRVHIFDVPVTVITDRRSQLEPMLFR